MKGEREELDATSYFKHVVMVVYTYLKNRKTEYTCDWVELCMRESKVRVYGVDHIEERRRMRTDTYRNSSEKWM